MSNLSVRLPNSLHLKMKELAHKEGVSMNQFISLAVAEKVSALLTADYLEHRAQRAEPKRYNELLDRVPNIAADPGDEW